METPGIPSLFEVEKRLLGLILKDNRLLKNVRELDLEDSDFTDSFNAKIFSLMVEAAEQKLIFTPEIMSRTLSREALIKMIAITQSSGSAFMGNETIEELAQIIKDNKALQTVQDLLVMISMRIEQRRPKKELLPFIAAIEKLNEEMKND